MRLTRALALIAAVSSFEALCADLSAPEPIFPKAGWTFSHYPRATELSWTHVAHAISYTVEVDCFHCCELGKWCSDVDKPKIQASGVSDARYSFVWVGANLGRWRVWAVGADGKESPKSAWQDFLYTR